RWQQAFEHAYNRLQLPGLKRLLATYFDGLGDNLHLAASLPVDGLHIDVVRAPEQLEPVLDRLPGYKVLSLGVVDGRNVWRADLGALLDRLEPLAARLGERLWLAPSCSLLHVPVDAAAETALDPVLQAGLAFAVQKLDELRLLRRGLAEGREAIAAELAANREALSGRQRLRTGREDGRRRVERLDVNASRRSLPYAARAPLQRAATALPQFLAPALPELRCPLPHAPAGIDPEAVDAVPPHPIGEGGDDVVLDFGVVVVEVLEVVPVEIAGDLAVGAALEPAVVR